MAPTRRREPRQKVYGMYGSDKDVAVGVGQDDPYGGFGNDTLRAAGDGD